MADIEVPHPGASEIVGRLLSEALSEHPDVQWLGLVSEDGFAIASEGQAAVDDDAVAAGAVRMMIQVRAMAKALGQEGTSQMFMEGSDSGICVIDKDPWVLVMVGAPGVPIGLLRYEAREIADAFPMNRRAELEAAVAHGENSQWWSAPDEDDSAETPDVDEPVDEIRWADEPISDDPSGVSDEEQVTDFIVVDPDGLGDLGLQDSSEASFDLAAPVTGEPEAAFDLATPDEPVEAVTFDLAAPDEPVEAVTFDLAAPAEQTEDVSFDLAPPADAEEQVSFDLAPPLLEESEPPAMAAGFAVVDELADLPAPSGPSIDLPPPAGPAFQLPPPV